MDELRDWVAAITDGLAAPITRWHQDELAHQERMALHEERMAVLNMAQTAIEKGDLDPAFALGFLAGTNGTTSQYWLPGS